MLAVIRKPLLAFVVVLVLLTTGAWQSAPAALAQGDAGAPETPLYPGLTWTSLGLATQSIRVNVNGDTISLAGERFAAAEQFGAGFPQELIDYYSNAALAAAGWASYDALDTPDGVQFVFYHEAGFYLAVEYVKCAQAPASTCLAVWKSAPAQPASTAAGVTAQPSAAPTAAGSFGKTDPTNGETNVNPSSVTLRWEASANVDKYKYCIQIDDACANDDPDWTSSYGRSVTLTNLAVSKTYYWQVRATSCETCVPKDWTYANGGTAWWFKTKSTGEASIVGNAGVGSAVLNYRDGTDKHVTADSHGAYTIQVASGWSGTVTPTKAGYIFTPPSATFTSLAAGQTIQNFTAQRIFVIRGSAGVAGATLSYTSGATTLTVTADASGNYAISVPSGWTGTVTPSKAGYVFTPPNRSYTNLAADQSAQNFTAALVTYTISGLAGAAGVTLTYNDVNNVQQFVTSDGIGSYSITVPSGWTGTVTPHKVGFSFTPASRSYTSVQASATTENYTAAACSSCADKDTVGVFRPSNGLLYLKNLNITGFADVAINYGIGGDYPVVGDWDGDGTATIGVYRNGSFYLRNSNTLGFADLVFPFGSPGDQPVAGDWDNNGTDTIGVFRSAIATFYLRNSNSEGLPDISFVLGNPGDVAIAGDWNNDGTDTTGVFRPSNGIIFLKNQNTTGVADIGLNYGVPGDKPVTGDWNNDGTDTIGVLRGNVFYLRNANTPGFADMVFALGLPGDMPIAGNWDHLP